MIENHRLLLSRDDIEMTTVERITEKLNEISSRASKRRDVPQLVNALTDAVATIVQLDTPPAQMSPRQRSRLANDTLDRIALILGARH